MMAQPSWFGGNGKSSYLRKVKIKIDLFCSRGHSRVVGMVAPLYVSIPKLINGSSISCKEFAEWYGLCIKCLNPKCIRLPKD
jgi:hypothetical protein